FPSRHRSPPPLFRRVACGASSFLAAQSQEFRRRSKEFAQRFSAPARPMLLSPLSQVRVTQSGVQSVPRMATPAESVSPRRGGTLREQSSPHSRRIKNQLLFRGAAANPSRKGRNAREPGDTFAPGRPNLPRHHRL